MRIRTLTTIAMAVLGVAATDASIGQTSSTGEYNLAGKFSSVTSAFVERLGHVRAGGMGGEESVGIAGGDVVDEKSNEIFPRRGTADITTTSYDELSQTVVTRTIPATDLIARPSCDADGVCSMISGCHVSFPGYIYCDTTTDQAGGVSTNPAATAVTFSTTLPAHETDPYSYQPMPTWTYSGAAARNRWIWPRMAGTASDPSTSSTSAEPASSTTCATDAVTFTAGVQAALQRFPPSQLNGTLRLTSGALFDQSSRMAYLGDNQEIMFDASNSRAAASADQWSVCHDGRFMYDGNGVWCSCQSGTGTHIFSSSAYCMRSECELVQMSAVGITASTPTSQAPSTSTVTAVITTTISSCPPAPTKAIFSTESTTSTSSCSESPVSPAASSTVTTTTSPDVTTSTSTTTAMQKLHPGEVVVSFTIVVIKTISPVAGGSATIEPSDASALPSGTTIPVILSKDGKCGSSVNQTCLFSSFGDCCSKQGMCGDSAEYCGLDTCDTNFLYSNCNEPRVSSSPLRKRAFRTVATETVRETLTVTVEEAKDVEPVSTGGASSYRVTTVLQILTTQVTVTSAAVEEPTTQAAANAPTTTTVLVAAVNSSAIVITNPLLPGWSSTISDWSVLNPHINNTNTDTESYLNISTYSMAGQPTASPSASTTLVETTSENTVTSSHVIRPSATAAGTTNNLLVPGFTAAATSNIGKNSASGEMAPSGMVHVYAAGATLLALCFGVMVWL